MEDNQKELNSIQERALIHVHYLAEKLKSESNVERMVILILRMIDILRISFYQNYTDVVYGDIKEITEQLKTPRN